MSCCIDDCLNYVISLADCLCNQIGTVDNVNMQCNTIGGQCSCKPGVFGRKCDKCLPGHYNFTNNGCTRKFILINEDYSISKTRIALFSRTQEFHLNVWGLTKFDKRQETMSTDDTECNLSKVWEKRVIFFSKSIDLLLNCFPLLSCM